MAARPSVIVVPTPPNAPTNQSPTRRRVILAITCLCVVSMNPGSRIRRDAVSKRTAKPGEEPLHPAVDLTLIHYVPESFAIQPGPATRLLGDPWAGEPSDTVWLAFPVGNTTLPDESEQRVCRCAIVSNHQFDPACGIYSSMIAADASLSSSNSYPNKPVWTAVSNLRVVSNQ